VWETRGVQGGRDIIGYASELQRANGAWGSGGGRGEFGEQLPQACMGRGHNLVADLRLKPGTQQSNANDGPKCRHQGRGCGADEAG